MSSDPLSRYMFRDDSPSDLSRPFFVRNQTAEVTMKSYGGFAIHDSGNPNNGFDYVTLVILHGFAWHSGS